MRILKFYRSSMKLKMIEIRYNFASGDFKITSLEP